MFIILFFMALGLISGLIARTVIAEDNILEKW